MIRTEAELQAARQRLAEEAERLAEHEQRLVAMSLTPDEVKRALDPLRSFHKQLEAEVAEFERIKDGHVREVSNLHGLGRALVAIRIALGLTQRELAERLGVNESQVSRDERNEYRGVTVERACRVLDALGVEMTTSFAIETGEQHSLTAHGNRLENDRERAASSPTVISRHAVAEEG
jgi:transcriptional regulator with XRE-family HTH domain